MKRAAPPPSGALAEGLKQLVIKRVRSQGDSQFTVTVPLDGDVAGIKQALEAAGGPKRAQASFVYNGQLLQDAWTTEAIPHGATIMLFVRQGPPPVPPRRHVPSSSTGSASDSGSPHAAACGTSSTAGAADAAVREAVAEEGDCECPICLDTFNAASPAVTTACMHKFHSPCLTEWQKHSHFCPLCRGRLAVPAAAGAASSSAGAGAGTATGAATGTGTKRRDEPLTREEALAALEATRKAVVSVAGAAYALVTSEEAKQLARDVYKGAMKYGKMLASYAGQRLARAAAAHRDGATPAAGAGAGSGAGAGAGAGAATSAAPLRYQCPRCRRLVEVAPSVTLFKCACGQVMRAGS